MWRRILFLAAVMWFARAACGGELAELTEDPALPERARSQLAGYLKSVNPQAEKFASEEDSQRQRFLSQMQAEARKLKPDSDAAAAAKELIEALSANDSTTLATPNPRLPSGWQRAVKRHLDSVTRREEMYLKRTRTSRERLLKQVKYVGQKTKKDASATAALGQLAAALAKQEVPARFEPGFICFEYPKHSKQIKIDDKVFVPEKDLGEPVAVYVRQSNARGGVIFNSSRNLVARGYLLIREPGKYAFTVYGHHSGGASMAVGGNEIKQGKNPTIVSLKRGLAPFVGIGRLRNNRLDIKWKPPWEVELVGLPAEIVYHDSWLAASKLKAGPAK